jgi:hypothetical protein
MGNVPSRIKKEAAGLRRRLLPVKGYHASGARLTQVVIDNLGFPARRVATSGCPPIMSSHSVVGCYYSLRSFIRSFRIGACVVAASVFVPWLRINIERDGSDRAITKHR